MRTRHKAIARVVKTHGKRGEVVAVPVHGLPPLLRKDLDVFPVPPPLKGPRSRKVLAASVEARGQLVSLEGVGDLGSSSKLVGKTLLAREADLPGDLGLHDPEGLIGRDVRDVRGGMLGTVVEVMLGPANDVWVVDGEHGEAMVPIRDEFVLGADEDGTICLRLPEGALGGEETDGV